MNQMAAKAILGSAPILVEKVIVPLIADVVIPTLNEMVIPAVAQGIGSHQRCIHEGRKRGQPSPSGWRFRPISNSLCGQDEYNYCSARNRGDTTPQSFIENCIKAANTSSITNKERGAQPIMANLFKASDFAASKAKPLPIILLLDESGSMFGESISSLNDAVRKMLATFKKEESQASEFLVSIIAFGGSNARTVNEPLPASQIEYSNLSANGGTPLGSAISIAKSMIEDKEKTPSRAYRPLVVLVSDGAPTDNWESKFEDFIENGRTAKCDRMALAIGAGADKQMLARFVAGTEHEVFDAKDASEIVKFFKYVTMSVVTRTQQKDPNIVPKDSTLEPPAHAQAAAPPQVPAPAPASDDGFDW